ncbi:hypothetical protein B0H13DRAFT_2661257 [Mycena leptocephala]|nr:hypothetical protein B0H13DRAFT_2661257 [Mycena leptocephala]
MSSNGALAAWAIFHTKAVQWDKNNEAETKEEHAQCSPVDGPFHDTALCTCNLLRGVHVMMYIADAQAIQTSIITSGSRPTAHACPSDVSPRITSSPPAAPSPADWHKSLDSTVSPIASSHIQWRVPNPSPPTRTPRPNTALRTNTAPPRPPSPPSPPTLAPSSSVSSLDRSVVSTPGRPSPPPPAHTSHPAVVQQRHYATYDLPCGYQGGYMYAPPPAQYHPLPHAHPDDAHRGYDGHPHPHAQYAPQPFPITHGGYVPYPLPGTILSVPMAPPQGGGSGTGVIQAVHTDDAATKLSDRVRRRCFNCCTTDTSTWRRSNLSPGKVLCNKYGLLERTHSCPRPEQFPHKRGPLASSTLRSRSPPQAQKPRFPFWEFVATLALVTLLLPPTSSLPCFSLLASGSWLAAHRRSPALPPTLAYLSLHLYFPYQTPAHYPPPGPGSYPPSASAPPPANGSPNPPLRPPPPTVPTGSKMAASPTRARLTPKRRTEPEVPGVDS